LRKCTGNNTQEWGLDAIFYVECKKAYLPDNSAIFHLSGQLEMLITCWLTQKNVLRLTTTPFGCIMIS
jgi:hypothetical protein